MTEVRNRKWVYVATLAAGVLVAGAATVPNLPEPPPKPTVVATKVHDDGYYKQHGIETVHRISVRPDDTQVSSQTYCLESATTGCVIKSHRDGKWVYEYVAVFTETVADITVDAFASPFTEIKYTWGTSINAPNEGTGIRTMTDKDSLFTVPSANIVHAILTSTNPLGHIYITARTIR